MKKWIRWQGVLAFIMIAALLFTLFFLLIDLFVERAIEKTATLLVGARVELDKADLTISPLGLTLFRLQVTNPKAPMTNAFEISKIAFLLNAPQLIRRKAIIEEMSIDTLQFNTQRRVSGAIQGRQQLIPRTVKETITPTFGLPSLDFPDPRKIIEKEEILSIKLIQALREDLQAEKAKWQEKLDRLPNRDKFEEYQERLETLKSSGKGGIAGLLGATSEVIALRKEITQDLDQLKELKETLDKEFGSYRKRIEEVTQAPLNDLRRLKEKYSLSSQGLSNLSRLIFGEKIGGWAESGIWWYEKMAGVMTRMGEQEGEARLSKPLRGKGVDVHFKEREPLPDFWIRKTRLSVILPAGTFSGQVINTTSDQVLIGTPLTFAFSGEKLKGLHSIWVEGTMNRVNPSKPNDEARVKIRGLNVEDFPISKSKSLPIDLKKAVIDLEGRGKINGEILSTQITADLQSVRFSSGNGGSSEVLMNIISSTLSEIQGFQLVAEISGTLNEYAIHLTSDLDRILKAAVSKEFTKQLEHFEAGLKTALSQRVGPELAALDSAFGDLEGVTAELNSRLKLGDSLLKDLLISPKKGRQLLP